MEAIADMLGQIDRPHLKHKEAKQRSVPSDVDNVIWDEVSAVTIQVNHVLPDPLLSSVECAPFCACRNQLWVSA